MGYLESLTTSLKKSFIRFRFPRERKWKNELFSCGVNTERVTGYGASRLGLQAFSDIEMFGEWIRVPARPLEMF